MSIVTLHKKNIFLWCLLGFQAGAINAGGFIAAHRFVTHTTGFATHFAVEFAQSNWSEAIGMLTVPFFFLFGTMITSYFVDLPQQSEVEPNYKVPALLIFLSLAIATALAEAGFFGVFGEEATFEKDYFFLVLLCLASGLQNALITNGAGIHIRTTHLTGLTTDIGVGLTRLIFMRKDAGTKIDLLLTGARVGIIFSFILGSSSAAFLLYKTKYLGFALPLLTAIVLLKYFLFTKDKL